MTGGAGKAEAQKSIPWHDDFIWTSYLDNVTIRRYALETNYKCYTKVSTSSFKIITFRHLSSIPPSTYFRLPQYEAQLDMDSTEQYVISDVWLNTQFLCNHTHTHTKGSMICTCFTYLTLIKSKQMLQCTRYRDTKDQPPRLTEFIAKIYMDDICPQRCSLKALNAVDKTSDIYIYTHIYI